MSTYLIPIQTALVVFPFIAFFMTVPYMIVQYRKFGSIPVLRTIIIFSFVLYLLSSYFLVILPLPPVEEVANYTTPTTQWVPFTFVADFFHDSGIVIQDSSTYLPALLSQSCLQVVFNILLLLPLGIYLRYYFKRNWWQTLLICLGTSLFFEITQLTGLYGIYPRSYRLFDVDDLMLNTLGGMLGFLICPIIQWILPKKEEIDKRAYEKGRQVSFLRRLMAFLTDWCILATFLSLLLVVGLALFPNLKGINFFSEGIYASIIGIYFIFIPWLTKGYTPGKALFRLKITTIYGDKPKLYQYVIRYVLLYAILLQWPVVIGYIWKLYAFLPIWLGMVPVIFTFEVLTLVVWFGVDLFCLFFGIRKETLYDTLSKTKNISTIDTKYDEKIENG